MDHTGQESAYHKEKTAAVALDLCIDQIDEGIDKGEKDKNLPVVEALIEELALTAVQPEIGL